MLDNSPARIHNNKSLPDKENEIINNLGANRYGRFLERPSLSQEIVKALNGENYIVLVYGQGGIGKSALVYNIVTGIVDHRITLNTPIDNVFWFSDADDPGNLSIQDIVSTLKSLCNIGVSTHSQPTLETSLTDIQKALDYKNGSIIVIDNLETITDLSIWDFILKDGPRKCIFILTSKYNVSYYKNIFANKKTYRRELDSCVTSIKVPKVRYEEWVEIFSQKRKDVPLINYWADSLGEEHLKHVLDLVHSSLSGNVYGMNTVISILAKRNIAYEDIDSVIDSEFVLKDPIENIAKSAWGLLTPDGQKVLISSVLNGPTELDFKIIFQYCRLQGINVETGKVIPGSKLEDAIIECVDLNLIEIDYENGNAFYYISPFIYHFIVFKLKNHELDDFDTIINRWIFSYVSLAESINFCFNDPRRMLQLDDPVKRNSLLFVLDYCLSNKECWTDYIKISKYLRYYFYTRAIWSEGDNCIHIKRANLAKKLGNQQEEFDALTYYINIAAKYHEISSVNEYIQRADAILNTNNQITRDSIFRYQHAKGLYYYSDGNYDTALKIWDNILEDDAVTDNIHDKDAAERWRLKCTLMLHPNDADFISSVIIPNCEKLLKRAKNKNMERSLIDYTLLIVDSYIILEQYPQAKTYLDNIEPLVLELNDVLYTARLYLYKALCSTDEETGCQYIKVATDCFLSLKIKHELEYLKAKVEKKPPLNRIVFEMIKENNKE